MKKNSGKIKVIKKFKCTSETKESLTLSVFSAIVRQYKNKKYILKVKSIKFVDDEVIIDNTAHMYFNTLEELEKEFTYHYELCKGNLYTTKIKITI